jgi:hypothetical protein
VNRAARETAIVDELEPAEAAELLSRLERGQQAAWRAAHREAEPGRPRAALAEDLNRLSVDEITATAESGVRQPGESIDQFQARVTEPEAEGGWSCTGVLSDSEFRRVASLPRRVRRQVVLDWEGHRALWADREAGYEAGS